jgi:AbrB family looped-hinge helix DNA binding protein
MVTLSITKMSSKGQIVIPKEMRENFEKGNEILILKTNEEIILKNKKEVESKFLEDYEFSKRIKEAYKRYDNGEFISCSDEEFIKEIEKW